jgi:hypothetical protein
LNKEDISHLNKLVTSNETEALIKSIPTKKSLGLDGFYQTFREGPNTYPPQTFLGNRKGRNITNSIYDDSITLIPKPNKDAK